MADNYSGATTEALVITGITAALSGNLYRCRVTNEYGARYSDAALLTVGAPCAPICNTECDATGLDWYCDPGCFSLPVNPDQCDATWYPAQINGCGDVDCPPSSGTNALRVRAIASCLVVGRQYKITLTFSGIDQLWCCDPGDDCPADRYACPKPWVSITEIEFTATDTTETTNWVNAPAPDGTPYNEVNTVTFDGCGIEEL